MTPACCAAPLLELPGVIADLGYEYIEPPWEERARESCVVNREEIERRIKARH